MLNAREKNKDKSKLKGFKILLLSEVVILWFW